MMITTLEGSTLSEITTVFNDSFADYILPMQLTEEQLSMKMKTDRVDLRYSVGVVDQGVLVGFILHGTDIIDGKKVLYNGGTGVVPTYRGQRLVGQMYAFLKPLISDFYCSILEVIVGNDAAIKSYENVGFSIERQLNCYKADLQPKKDSLSFAVTVSKNYDWDLFQSFWDWKPTWSSTNAALSLLASTNILLTVELDHKVVGYLIYHPLLKRIQQFAVAKETRNRGIAASLFTYVVEHYTTNLSVINVDHTDEQTNSFLLNRGFEKYIQQYEMRLKF